MTQTTINFRPLPDNPFRPGSQNWRLYERAKEGPVTNGEILYKMHIANSTGRASDVREFLEPHGFRFPGLPTGNGGEFVYEIQ